MVSITNSEIPLLSGAFFDSLQIEDCCTRVTAPSVVEVCSRFTKDSATAIISCSQFRRGLSTASSGMCVLCVYVIYLLSCVVMVMVMMYVYAYT